MQIKFKKIFLPVDFSINTQVAVKRTLELIEPEESVIYLYHVILHNLQQSLKGRGFFIFKPFKLAYQSRQARYKLFQWKYAIQKEFPGTKIKIEIEIAGSIQKSIIRKSLAIQPDLIIIGKGHHHSSLSFMKTISSARIAAKTNVPVLSVKRENLHDSLKSIVMPIGNFVPKRKIEMLIALSKKFRIRVYLITVTGNNNWLSPNALFTTYQLLKHDLQCPMEYRLLHNYNSTKAVLHYAEQVNADMLLVNTESERKFSFFTGRHITDVVSPDSNLQILSLKP